MDWKTLASTFGAVFVAELGDKTQLATMSMAAGARVKWAVFVGAALALVATSAIAVLAGSAVTRVVPTPWLRRIELAVSNDGDLAFQRQYVRFEIDALLRPDSAGRAAFYTAALDPITGWMTRDEVRALEDLEPEPAPDPVQTAITQMTAAQGVNGNG